MSSRRDDEIVDLSTLRRSNAELA